MTSLLAVFSITLVTFDAKPPFAAPAEMILEEGADIGVVASNAGHRQVIARVPGFLSDGMSR